jgi:ribose 5-phosphate isomerase B
MKIAFGNDHAALEMRDQLVQRLRDLGHDVADYGAKTPESVDYPDFAKRVAKEVVAGRAEFGVLICGSGVGMSIAANKVHGARAVLATDPYAADMGRRHNNANVLCLRAREQTLSRNFEILDAFLAATFEGGRHARRVEKIAALDAER